MKLLKFGGSSLRDANIINTVLKIIINNAFKSKPIIIVSAMGSVTDTLIDITQNALKGKSEYLSLLDKVLDRHLTIANHIVDDTNILYLRNEVNKIFHELRNIFFKLEQTSHISNSILDHILSFGERLSALIIASGLRSNQINAEYLDSRKIIKTDNTFGEARIDFKKTNHLVTKHFESNNAIQVVTGFIGSTEEGETTTLGRNGSDYTATVIGAALNVESIEIWTDVDGILTADPNKIPNAVSFQHLNYYTALEYSKHGANVISPKTIDPILNKSIELRVKNTFNPGFIGTIINNDPLQTDSPKFGIVSANIHSIPIEIKNRYSTLINSNVFAIINIMLMVKIKNNDLQNEIVNVLRTVNIDILDIFDNYNSNTLTIIVNKYDETTAIDLLHKYFVVSIVGQQFINNNVNRVNP